MLKLSSYSNRSQGHLLLVFPCRPLTPYLFMFTKKQPQIDSLLINIFSA